MNNRHQTTETFPLPRIGDISDWRLIVYIRKDGMSAYLKNLVNPTDPIAPMFHSHWEKNEAGILPDIENAVYDHSQILDDFSTDIIIETDRLLWVPARELEEEYSEEKIFNSVYPAAAEDIHVDNNNDIVCLYTLTPGLNSFLKRTFPGSRVASHLTPIVGKLRERTSDSPRIYIDIREGEADFIGFDGKKLLLGATHFWNTYEDIAYHLFNILNVYELDPTDVQVSLSSNKEQQPTRQELMWFLRKHLSFVMLTMLPKLTGGEEMPLAATFCANRLPKKNR